MDLFSLQAKIGLDTSEYVKGVKESADYSKKLKDELKNVDSEVKDLTSQYKKSVSQTGRYSDETKELADKLKDAKDRQKDLKEELQDSEKISSRLSGNFGSLSSVISGVAKGATVAVGAIAAIGGALLAAESASEEYRIAQGKLNTAFESAGFGANTAKEAYRGLYEIIGDTDTATEAAQLLAKLADSAEDVSEWVGIAAGVAGTFGDALPINSLIEATNETAKVGEVTGVLADALNWAGISEDEFNKKLAACTDESDRNRLIMETLSGTYNDATNAFYENNAELVKSRDNQIALDDALAQVGGSVTVLKNNLLTQLTPAISTVAGWISDLVNEANNAVTSLGNLAGKAQTFFNDMMSKYVYHQTYLATGSKTDAQYAYNLYGNNAAEQESKRVQAEDDSVVSNAQKNAFVIEQTAKKAAQAITSVSTSASTATTKAAATTQKTVEQEKTLLEKLQEAYKTTYGVLSNQLSSSELEYQLWEAQLSDAATEVEKLTGKLDALNEQHGIQQEAVNAAQKAYDDYLASEEATTEGAEELRNELLKQQVELAKLETEISDTTDALNEQTDAYKKLKDAADEAYEASDNFAGALSSLGGDVEDVGELIGSDLVSNIGSLISKMGGGISTVLSFANSIFNLVSAANSLSGALGVLSGASSAVGGVSGILSGVGSAVGGSGILGALGIGAVAATGIAGGLGHASNVAGIWSDSSKGIGEKLIDTIKDLAWSSTPMGVASNAYDFITGLLGKKTDEPSVSDELESITSSPGSSIDVSGTTTASGGDTIIERVDIYIEGAQYDTPDSLAEAISEKLQNLTERRISVYA